MRYWAFISYSHADERHAGWLHRAIEHYRLPAAIRERLAPPAGATSFPARLQPVFRDRDELASSPELGREIESALEASRSLIVLCSPSAARSRWVNEEIRYFQSLGRADRIHCLIVDGEPDGGERDCFPPTLLQGADGRARIEPIAADLRPGRDGRRDALLKLVAGLLGLGLDALRQRDLAARNRRLLLAMAASVAIALLTAGLAVTAYHARNEALVAQAQALVAQREAEQSALESRESADFLVGLLASADRYEHAGELTVRQLLDEGARRVDAELATQPIVAARLHVVIGKAFWSLSRWDDGEQRMQRGLAMLREIPGTEEEIAGTLADLGYALVARERYDEAERYYRESLVMHRELHGPDDLHVAEVLVELARVAGQRDRSLGDAQRESLEEALSIYERAGLTERWAYVNALGNLANFHKLRLEWERARELFVETRRVADALVERPAISYAYLVENLARFHYFEGDYAAARRQFDDSLALLEAQMGPDAMELDWSLYYLARIEREQGNRDKARDMLERVIANGTANPQTPDHRYRARAQCGLGLLLAESGDVDAGRALCARGEATLRSSGEQTRVQMNVVHEAMTVIALHAGEFDEAVRRARAHVAVLELGLDRAQTDQSLALGMLGAALAARGDNDEALAAYGQALAYIDTNYPANYPTAGRVHWARAALLEARGETAAAGRDRKRARDLFARHGLQPQDENWVIARRDEAS